MASHILLILGIMLLSVSLLPKETQAGEIPITKVVAPGKIFSPECTLSESETDEMVIELANGELPPEIKLPVTQPILIMAFYEDPGGEDFEIRLIFHASSDAAEKHFRENHKTDKARPLVEVGEIDEKSASSPFYKFSALDRSFLVISRRHNVTAMVSDLGNLKTDKRRLEILEKQMAYLDSVAEGNTAKANDSERKTLPTATRTWTSKDGKTIIGKIISADQQAGTVTLERSDGQKFSGFPIQNLSTEDQNYLLQFTGKP